MLQTVSYTPCPDKKGATDFLLYLLQILTDFHNFRSQLRKRISCHTFVMLLPYHVKVLDTKVTHFTPILALCTCLHRSHLQKPVSMKQTKHSRKSEAQNLCSKYPQFTRTHAFKRLRHCAIAAAMTVCMLQQPPLLQQTFFQLLHIMDARTVDPLLKHAPNAVVYQIQIW